MIFDTNLIIGHIIGLSARNMGKKDLWIAVTALYFDEELYTTDNDFNHLPPYGLRLVNHS